MRTIQYRVPIEKMITRLPGLFAYLGEDGYGNIVLHKATESLNGCYGKIVENIKLPKNVNLEYDGVKLNEGEVYSFRTLITYYYMFKDKLEETNPFRLFIEKGIGKIKVDTTNFKKGVATPEYVYLSNVRQLYNQLVKMSHQCKLYQQHISNDVNLCCICEKYDNMGGDGFKDYIYSLISEAEKIANEYYKCAVKDNHLTLDFDIDIMCSEKDYGIMSSYMPQWLPYKKYYKGDKVYYDGKIWSCIAETTGKFDADEHRVVFDEKSFEEYSYSIDDDTSQDTINGQTDSKLCDLRRIVTYRNEDNEAEVPESGYDWLFYYRKGNVVNVNTLTDENGNILSYKYAKDGIMVAAKSGDDLLAYGDVITDIKLDITKKTIKFDYVQGVRLQCEDKDKIIDGEKIIWRKLEPLEECDEGISYSEIYTYNEGSDLENFKEAKDDKTEKTIYVFSNGMYQHNESSDIITSSKFEELPPNKQDNYTLIKYSFEDYITGKCDIALKNYKFEFVTSNNTITYEKVIGNQEANIVSILTDFNIYRKNNYDNYMNSENIRYDFYNGISYSPSVKHDVNINRGSTAVFQKHIALSEIKTLNDLTEYKNGSFFNISKT